MELEGRTPCSTLQLRVGEFERGGNFPSQSGKVARFRAIHTSACHLFTPRQAVESFHSAMESFHLVQIRQQGVGTLNDVVGGSNSLLADLNEMETFHRRVETFHRLPRCEQMASRGVNGPKSCNFSTLRWKVSTSFKPANKELEGPTTCRRRQHRVGDAPTCHFTEKVVFSRKKRVRPRSFTRYVCGEEKGSKKRSFFFHTRRVFAGRKNSVFFLRHPVPSRSTSLGLPPRVPGSSKGL